MKGIVNLSIFIVMSYGLISTAAAVDSGSSPIGYNEALSRALEYTGFPDTEGFSLSAMKLPSQTTAFEGETIPALKTLSEGRTVWQFHFPQVRLYADSNRHPKRIGTARSFDVFIDAETSRLIKISSNFDQKGKGFSEDKWAGLNVAFDNKGSDSIYFAGGSAPTTFVVALESCPRIDGSMSNQIEAYLVELRWVGIGQRPVLLPKDSVPFWLFVSRELRGSSKSLGEGRVLVEWVPEIVYALGNPSVLECSLVMSIAKPKDVKK